ncbi:MAG: ABC transporter permease [Chloroflexi bacterium]|nr:ABC transporter permease [Chloroflexota bacterium]
MADEIALRTEAEQSTPRVSEFRRVIRLLSQRGVVTFGFVTILAFIFLAIFAPYITTYKPYEADLSQALLQPSRGHLLGTDPLGRDLLTRVIYGTRISLLVGVAAVFLAGVIGQTMGLAAGYVGGRLNTVVMRFVDALMSFPSILLALAIAAILGVGTVNLVVALGISMVPSHARLMCAQALSIRENDYILAGRVMGASNLRIMVRHVLPNAFPPIMVMLTLEMGMVILAEAGLSFLGLGVPPPTPTWGVLVSEGREYLLTNPLVSLAPGVAIMLLVFAFNMVGDGLRDALDPRLRGRI